MKFFWLRLCLFLICAFVLSTALYAQESSSSAAKSIDESVRKTLPGTVHPLARTENDKGAASDDMPMRRLMLMMARPADREKSLQQYLIGVHTPGSSAYHQWITPDEFGSRFGASDEDIQMVSGWLQSHGLSVGRVTKSKSMIEFSGTAGQIREALHTEIHHYSAGGKSFYANAGNISLPQAIASRVKGFAPLNNIPLDSYVKAVGGGTMNRANHKITPQFTLTNGTSSFYALGPEDFATQYDVSPVYTAGVTGSGETIGIIGTNSLNLQLVDAYRKLFNLPADHTQVVVDGEDPGDWDGIDVEGYLDVEVSGAVAKDATVNYYIAGGSAFEDTLALAALRAVEDNQASVLSVSYGNCEQAFEEAGNQLWNGLWEQAAAQGQTVFVSSGDSGPEVCQGFYAVPGGYIEEIAGLNVNGISSTPWNVSVGGTDFYYSDYLTGGSSITTYWNQTNDSSNGSLKTPIPEQRGMISWAWTWIEHLRMLQAAAG
jgi:subtilase family serine protease